MFELIRYDVLRQCQRASFWVIAALVQFLFGWLFLEMLESYLLQQSSANAQNQNLGFSAFLIANYLAPSTTVLMFATPLLSMGLLSEAYKDGSYRLLQAAPLSSAKIAWAKFCSGWLIACLLLLPLLALPLASSYYLPIAPRPVALAFIALALFIASCIALSLWVSQYTHQPMLAAMAGFCLLLLLWVLSHRGGTLAELSPLRQLSAAFSGVLDLQQLAYFPLLSLALIALLARQLDNQRLHGG